MSTHYSGCEGVEIGIQIEKNGKDFYSHLAEVIEDKDTADLFRLLAGEEAKHIEIFKDIFSESCDYNPSGAYSDEYFAYVRALAGQYVFTMEDKGVEAARSAGSRMEALDLAIGLEKDSILLYEEIRKTVPEKQKEVLDRVLTEEKKHLRMLCDMKGGCDNEECKSV